MTLNTRNAANAYLENAVMTASPAKIVKMLYDKLLQHLESARVELVDPQRRLGVAASASLSKALAIVAELRNALDFTADSDVPRNLDRIYDFVTQRLTEANIKRASAPVEEAVRALRPMKEAWDELVTRGA